MNSLILLAISAGIGAVLIAFAKSFRRWEARQTGDANELHWLDKVVREHLAGKQDHTETIRRAITDIENDHIPSQSLAREIRRAREAIGHDGQTKGT